MTLSGRNDDSTPILERSPVCCSAVSDVWQLAGGVMMLETKPVAYRIAWCDGPVDVVGYAVNSPTGVRYCVRMLEDGTGCWTADDWDTGMSMFNKTGLCDTKAEMIEAAEKVVSECVADGSYFECQRNAIDRLLCQEAFDG